MEQSSFVLLIISLQFSVPGLVEIWFLVDDMVMKGYSRQTGAFLLSVIGIAILISRIVDGAFLAVIRYFRVLSLE